MRHEAATSQVVAAGQVAQVRERLHRRAWVFDDPRSYLAGVEEALQALAAPTSVAERSPVETPRTAPGLGARTA